MNSLTKAIDKLAITLLKKLCEENLENVVFSPPSILFILAMVLLGAQNNTADQIKKSLFLERNRNIDRHFLSLLTEMNKPNVHCLIHGANRVFGENVLNFLPSFKESCKKFYDSDLEDVCFSEEAETVRKYINAWVAEKTGGTILELLPEDTVNPLSLLIFVNIINFKLKWKNEAEPMKRTLRSHKEKHKMAKFTVKEGIFLGFYSEELGANVCRSTYNGEEWNIIFVLPVDDGKKMAKRLTYEIFTAWMNPEVVALMEILHNQLFLPKFKVEKSYNMAHILCSLGISDAFNEDKADFSGLSTLKDIYLLSVFHSSSLELNEEGIKASAATAAVEIPATTKGEKELKTQSFFLFFIWSHTINSILFCGRASVP
ncbi:serpin B8-like [Gracilinanus agilis]|uniref:serpin B8-like n=1 Tax=Gracilinanus agilis TaxID=191870 RepID=UPI001CFEF13B|nr:serpin B8-like [Gracilinanus agilis]